MSTPSLSLSFVFSRHQRFSSSCVTAKARYSLGLCRLASPGTGGCGGCEEDAAPLWTLQPPSPPEEAAAADGGMAGRFTGDLARRGAACGCGCCGSWLRLVDTERSGKKFDLFYLR